MISFKRLTALLMALLMCLSLAACSSSDDPEAGNDWRTTGIVVGSGTITHDGDSVDVLVTISSESAAFYRDEAEQILFDSVSFPVAIPDAKDAFTSISFDDLSADGESDVYIRFEHENGDSTELVWIWDPDERYVFSEDLSSVSIAGGSYFEDNDLYANAAVDNGSYLLERGICSYANLGDGYTVGDCYWEVKMISDQTHDGIRELEFDAVCYVPKDSVGSFSGDYITNTDSELYDEYTGMWLTAASSYGDSERGDNYYLHTVSANGKTYDIEFAYSTDWQSNVDKWASVLTKSYVVYLPEDYDGLIFAAETQPDNYKDSAKRMQLDSISPEACLMDIVTLDARSNLYFDICLWGDRIFEKCGIRRDEGGDGGKTLEIRGKRRLPARDGGANYQQS